MSRALVAIQNKLLRHLPFHYGWVIVFAGMMATFSALGLARFSFGVLLPSMSESLHLSYAERGYLSSGYLVGYLVMVAIVPVVNARLGGRLAVTLGLLIVSTSMILVGFAQGFVPVLLLYTVTGIGSGLTNVPMMALLPHWFAPGLRGRAAGLIAAGSSLAIILSGIMIPALNQYVDEEGWRLSWIVLGVISLSVALLAWLLVRNEPGELGYEVAGQAANRGENPAAIKAAPNRSESRHLVSHFGVIYLLFGATYMIYATFIVTALVDERGFSESSAGVLWAWIGVLSIFSGALFGYVSDKTSRKFGIMCAFVMQTLAYFLAGMSDGMLPVYASIILFGLSAWAIPAIMAAAMGDYFGPTKAVWAFSIITFFFALGQVMGPAGAGLLAEVFGDFSSAFWVSAALTGIGIIATIFLKKPAS